MTIVFINMRVFISIVIGIMTIRQTVSDKQNTDKINGYVDMFLPMIREYMPKCGLDVMNLPNISEGFNYAVILVTYRGSIDLTDGHLYNLRSLQRTGDIELNKNDKIITMILNFGFENIKFDYNYSATMMDFGPHGTVLGTVSSLALYVDCDIDFKNKKIILRQLSLRNVGNIDVKLNGNPLMDFASNIMIEVITKIFKTIVLIYVQMKMRNVADGYIDKINSSPEEFKKFVESTKLDFLEFIL